MCVSVLRGLAASKSVKNCEAASESRRCWITLKNKNEGWVELGLLEIGQGERCNR